MSRDHDTAAGQHERLRADHPDWVIQHMPAANLPWEARRKPFRMPPTGGYGWIHADTADRLAELIGGALQVEAQLAVETAARARLDALRVRLLAVGFGAELAAGELTVIAPVSDGPRLSDVVTCRPRLEDDGRLWFFDHRGEPIAEADNVTDAVVHLGGTLRRVGP
ncbi:hypothetical protein [Actinomadura chokoriensis]|uniref:Uncharacterized protein n=1 Tax=Actinomadura chokoriensis TaxID=454156 RepID=A0ABV4QSW3_9ACTN